MTDQQAKEQIDVIRRATNKIMQSKESTIKFIDEFNKELGL